MEWLAIAAGVGAVVVLVVCIKVHEWLQCRKDTGDVVAFSVEIEGDEDGKRSATITTDSLEELQLATMLKALEAKGPVLTSITGNPDGTVTGQVEVLRKEEDGQEDD